MNRILRGITPAFLLCCAFQLASPAVAADARACDSGNEQLDSSLFTLQESNNTYLPDLAKIFEAAGAKATVSQVLDSANRAMSKGSAPGSPDEAWLWNSGDSTTTKWIPQGTTSSGDALASGTYEGRNVWLVSWYQAEGDGNVRISFVDRATHQYRHVLLVEPSAKDNFKSVAIHAGGIAWYGNALYVVDTSKGLRVFDMDNIWTVDIADGVGKTSAGKYTANSYAYVLPQSRSYTWQASSSFRHSWVSVDRADSPDTLLIGEYQTTDVNLPIRLVKYPLDYTNRRLQNTNGVVTATWAHCVNILRMQGGFARNDTFYLGRSNNANTNSDRWTWSPGSSAKISTGFFPPGVEDLSYNEARKEFYTSTEHVGKRWVLSYKGEVN
ncbi:hypothetical protein FE257_009311 [Aspergillus nanangensis]|uniref:Secreted protein n=1 Tax=Aspergillus nanangensis TaxID=2582783 RepID=A0AAD4CM02_ASPNN|nr:hypothetical protein FE257_009311 [Aspergillus nanangensis]